MKMTDADERALAMMQFARGYLTWNNMQEFDDALQHIRARLAADQQKGGGEVVYQVKLNGPIDAWVDTTESQFALAEDHEKRRRKLYTTPQPSIPAPAQQEVKRAQINLDAGWYARREAEARAMGYAGVADALDDLSERLEASRAQQDGKASGWEDGFFHLDDLAAVCQREGFSDRDYERISSALQDQQP